jgi:hypothetical protein
MPRAPREDARGRGQTDVQNSLPRPSLTYRLQAWREFQLALDPLATPKPLPHPPRRRRDG